MTTDEQQVKKSFITRAALFCVFAFAVLFVERTLRYNFLFTCTYRMQTVSTYVPILCSWCIYAAFIVFVIVKKGRISWGAIIPYIIIYLGYLVSTLINNANFDRWKDALIYSLPPLLLTAMAMSDEFSSKIFVKAATWVFTAMAALNILFELVPSMWTLISEWRNECFLGYHTLIGWPLTMGLMFALLDVRYNGRKWLAAIYIVLFFTNIAYKRPGGAVIGALFILLWLVFPFVKKLFIKWPLEAFVLISLALFAILMWCFEPFVNFAPIKAFIENVLHRDVTLSGRLYVWDGVKKIVAESPLIGYGFGESTQIFYESSQWNGGMVHAHNMFLQCLYEGGAVTLALGLVMLFYTSRNAVSLCKRGLSRDERKTNGGIFKLIIFVLLIMLQSDQDAYYNWYMLAFVCNMYLITSGSCNGKKN